MKGKINKDGNLLIERGGKFREQFCMHEERRRYIGCADWCPCFSEPSLSDGKHYEDGKPRIYLHICQNRMLAFEELEDLRE